MSNTFRELRNIFWLSVNISWFLTKISETLLIFLLDFENFSSADIFFIIRKNINNSIYQNYSIFTVGSEYSVHVFLNIPIFCRLLMFWFFEDFGTRILADFLALDAGGLLGGGG